MSASDELRPELPPDPSATHDGEDSGGATIVAPPDWSRQRTTAKAQTPQTVRSARVDPNVGMVLGGQYRLERPVGHGGTGRVYVATQLSLGRLVAVKILRPELETESSGEQFAERFFREASLAGSLSHPNIVTIHDYGRDDDGTCFIVMELVEGRSLKDLMKAGPMEAERALDLFAQITRGLRHAHRAGLVHRDVKPGNVQITPGDDGHEVAKLLDFGLVKSDLPEVTEITREGSFLGTPHYASPEQVRGQEADARSDLYALGVMLYRALTGVLPYYSRNSMALAMSHVRDPFPPMAERAPDVRVRSEHENIVQRLMQKDANKRYPDAESLLMDLEAALDRVRRGEPESRPIVVVPPSEPAPEPTPEPEFDAEPEPSVVPNKRPANPPVGPILVGGLLTIGLGLGGAYWKLNHVPPEPETVEVIAAAADTADWSAAVLEDADPIALQVALASEPSGATVWVAGEEVGTTPWVGSLAVDDGTHQTLELELDGYRTQEVVFDIVDGSATETVELEPVPRASKSRPATSARPAPTPRPKPASTPAPPRPAPEARPQPKQSAPPAKAAGTTVEGVAFTNAQARHALQMANSGSQAAFNGAGIRTQEFNRVKAGRPYGTLAEVGAAPGVGPKTLERMRDSAP
jgi:serine/threonine protein kinase